MSWKEVLFVLSGRLSRGWFWRWVLRLNIIAIAALVAMIGLAMAEIVPRLPMFVLAGIAIAAVTWSDIALSVKRLHDRGRSGHWLWLFSGVPLAVEGALNIWGGAPELFQWALLTIGVVAAGWGFVEMFLRRGEQGANPYGPDPLGVT